MLLPQVLKARLSAELWLMYISDVLVKAIMEGLGYPAQLSILLRCYNQPEFTLRQNPMFDATQGPNIEADCYFIHEVTTGIICTTLLRFSGQPVDLFTKAVPRDQMQNILMKLGMVDIYAPILY